MRSVAGVLLVLGGVLLATWAVVGTLLERPDRPSAAPRDVAAAPGADEPTSRLATPPAGPPATAPAVSGDSPRGRREAAVDGLVGRVLAFEDAAPIPDVWVELSGPPRAGRPPEDARIRAEAGTDASGRFVLPWPTEPGSWVRVKAPHGWARTEPWWLLAPTNRGGAPLEFRLRRRRRAPLVVELSDLRTGEPVPHYVLRVRDLEVTDAHDLLTDAQGRGASRVELMEGSWQLTLLDDPRMEPRATKLSKALDHEALPHDAPHELRIPVGPTWLLDLRGPPGLEVEELRSFLRFADERDEPSFAHDIVPVRSLLRDGWPWVRFHEAPAGFWIQEGEPLFLVVVDQAGTLRGEARVPATWGLHPDPVRIELRRTGSLAVEVVDGAARPVAGVRMTLRTGADGLETVVRSDGLGHGHFADMPEGEYVLRVVHDRHDLLELSLRLPPGETTRRVVLRAAAIGGPVEGVVVGREGLRSASRMARSLNKVNLTSIDGGGRSYDQRLTFEEQGDALVAAFCFDDVAAGEYRLWLTFADPLLWWPHELIVRPPATGLELREWAPGTLLELHLEATDAVTGEGLAEACLWLAGQDGRPPAPGLHASYAAIVLPRGVPFTWGLGAPGHLPRFGDADDLREGDGVLSAVIPLERGHGIRLDIVGPDGTPLAGARVVVDGEEVGTTDEAGLHLLRLDRSPASIEVRSGEWVSDGGVLDALRRGQPVCPVRLGGG